MIIDCINSPQDLKNVPIEHLKDLANEIREILISYNSKHGGHLASNLGIVEISIALNYVFDSPNDKMIYDVSHQTYVHKILTGRKNHFINNEIDDDITGYSNPLESEHDIFNIGHTSTSISLANGLAKARDLQGEHENIIAIIGDAALDGGEAFEALNYSGELGSNLIIVINDNNMSIPENHGSLNSHLNALRENDGNVKNNFFQALGLEYFFVKDGHDIDSLIHIFSQVKDTDHPVVIHTCTTKGKGYRHAETNPEKWHWSHPFNVDTGEFKKHSAVPKENYGSIIGEYLIGKIKKDKNVVAMTASVPAYFGFNSERRLLAGKQYIDVGIAEQNAVTMCAAIAKNGGKPVLVTGSSFYQRAYDQIEQEMCINKCAGTMLVAFSGIYGHDTNAHAGLFDISLLGNIPGLIYLAPSNKQDYLAMLDWSIEQTKSPVAIRIPWNGVYSSSDVVPTDYSTTKYVVKQHGSKVAILALGSFYQLGEEVMQQLQSSLRINATLIDPMFISGYDIKMLESLRANHDLIVTLEDGILSGGFGSKIAQYYGPTSMRVLCRGFSMDIPTKFDVDEMLRKNRLKPDQIVEDINSVLNGTVTF